MAHMIRESIVQTIGVFAAQTSNPTIRHLLLRYLDLCKARPVLTHKYLASEVFANNFLDMGKVRVVGLDMDYTLVSYTKKLQSLIYDHAVSHLVHSHGYISELLHLQYDPNFAIRGLTIDMKHGTLCKLSHTHRVSSKFVYKGKRQLAAEEITSLYGEARHISPDYRDTQMKPLNDLYSLAEACLLADTVDHFERIGAPYDPRVIVEDVAAAIQETHNSGALHSAIMNNIRDYVAPCAKVRSFLELLKGGGKQLFVSSNSGFEYVNCLLAHTVGNDWRKLFDVVVVNARKPQFYVTKRQFRRIMTQTGKLDTAPVDKLQAGMIYTQGSLEELKRLTGWTGPQVLYIGDNLWADLVEARRAHGWSTGVIIAELDEELLAQSGEAFTQLITRRTATRELLKELQSLMEADRRAKGDKNISDNENQVLELLASQLSEINNLVTKVFNKNFGSVFRTEGHTTLFGFSIRRYVDVYTSSLGNFEQYAHTHKFYPNQSLAMPHDPIHPAYQVRAFLHSDVALPK